MLNLSKEDLKKFGRHSFKIAKSNFNSNKCVDDFLNNMINN